MKPKFKIMIHFTRDLQFITNKSIQQICTQLLICIVNCNISFFEWFIYYFRIKFGAFFIGNKILKVINSCVNDEIYNL